MTPEELQAHADQHLKNFEVLFREAQFAMRQVWMIAPVDSEREAGAKSILNKMENVQKAFLHEFGPKDD